MKPDYSGPNVMNVVPALLGVTPGRVAPGAGRRRAGRRAARARRPGLGGVGPGTPACCPSSSALEGRPITTVVPSTTPGRAHLDHHRAPAGRHGITGFRIRLDDTRAQRDPLAAGRRQARRPSPPTCSATGRSAVARCRWSPRRSSAPPGSPARTSAAADFHGWQTTAVLVEHVRALVAGGAPLRVRVLPGCRRGRARVRARRTLSTRPSSRPPTGSSGALLDVLPDDVALLVTADHGQVQVGPDGWIGLGALDGMVDAYAGDGALPLPARAPGRGRRAPRRGRGARTATTPGSSRATSCSTRAGWAPTRAAPARRRVGDVVLAARDAVGFVDPTLPAGGRPDRSAHGSMTARRDARSRSSPPGAGRSAASVRSG